MTKRVLLFVGTYTRPAPYLETTHGNGIYIYELDHTTGAIHYLNEVGNIDSPSFLAISPDQRFLYATSEVWLWDEGTVSAYAIDAAAGSLSYLNKQPTLGSIAAFAHVDRTGSCLLVSNYWDGESVVLFPIRGDGRLAPPTSSHRHEGSGPNPDRQEKAHAHCIVPDLNNRYALSADLGIDQVIVYALDVAGSRLVPHGSLKLDDGSGPRHLALHPNGQYVYVIQELGSAISVLSYDSETGELRKLQSVSTLPASFAEHNQCSEIQITPSGRFIYGANRGHDSLVAYAVDATNGHLSYIGHYSTKGRTPRHFSIDPTGTFVLVGNQDSYTVVTFRIDPDTGALQDTGQVANVPTPVCLKMIEVG